MKIQVNGETRSSPTGSTVREASLGKLGFEGGPVAVERNGETSSRAARDHHARRGRRDRGRALRGRGLTGEGLAWKFAPPTSVGTIAPRVGHSMGCLCCGGRRPRRCRGARRALAVAALALRRGPVARGPAAPQGARGRRAHRRAARGVRARPVYLHHGEEFTEVTYGELGVDLDISATLAQAERVGHTGSLAERVREARAAKRGEIDLPLVYRVDLVKARVVLEALAERITTSPVDAQMDIKNRRKTPDVPGRTLDVGAQHGGRRGRALRQPRRRPPRAHHQAGARQDHHQRSRRRRRHQDARIVRDDLRHVRRRRGGAASTSPAPHRASTAPSSRPARPSASTSS
jgi:sulfur carrier protein ThiS